MSRRGRHCSGRRRDLVERLAPFVRPVEPEPEAVIMVSVEPIRWWLTGWADATGDTAAVLAREFGLDQVLVTELLEAAVRCVPVADARRVCTAIGIAFPDLRNRPTPE